MEHQSDNMIQSPQFVSTAHPVAGARSMMRQSHREAESSSFDASLVWVTFRRCWFWAVPAGLVLASVTVYIIMLGFVPRYRASHHLEANKDWLLEKGVMPTLTNLGSSERTIVFSELVLNSVLANESFQRFSLASTDLVEREQSLRKNLSVSGGGSTLAINYTDTDRQFAADVCNAVVEAYLQQRDTFDNRRILRLEEWLTPQVKQLEQQVEEQQQYVAQLAVESSGVAPGARVDAIESRQSYSLISNLRGQISDIEIELAMLDANILIRNPTAPSAASGMVPVTNLGANDLKIDFQRLEEMIGADKDVKEAKRRFDVYDKEVFELDVTERWRFDKDRFAEMKDLRDQWKESLEEARAKARESALVILEAELKVKREKRDEQLAELDEEKSKHIARRAELMDEAEKKEIDDRKGILRKQLAVLQSQYDAEAARLRERDGVNVQLQFANEDLARTKSLLHRVNDRLASIQMESKRGSSVLSVARATPPSRPVEDVPFKKMVMAGGAAFLVPFLLGLLWEFRIKRITDSEDLEKSQFLAPVIGELARAPSAGGSRNSRSRRVFEESVDSLRANLALSKDTRNARSFAIVSSMSGEGKSTAVSQLAISLAKACGKTVLIIDADMRCPDQHDVFGLPLEPGLNEVLREVTPLQEAINTELGELVHVLPAGRLKASPHRLISQNSMKALIDEALESYEYVIIDTAPVLSAGETLAVSAAVDSTLVCVMRDLTRMDSVTRTTHRLEASGAHVVGTIFSGVTQRQYAYRYGDYKYSEFTDLISG